MGVKWLSVAVEDGALGGTVIECAPAVGIRKVFDSEQTGLSRADHFTDRFLADIDRNLDATRSRELDLSGS